MKLFLSIVISLVINYGVFAQQKNYLKINVADCVNCVSVLSEILKKDPKITFVIHEKYLLDSVDLLEKFSLNRYASQTIWSGKLYDSLSKQFESEFIQYCGKEEVNRCGLRKWNYFDCNNINSNSICIGGLSNQVIFRDYQSFILFRNYITNNHYIYSKKLKKITPLPIDSNMVRSIYLNYLRDTYMYNTYVKDYKLGLVPSPKIMSLCPLNDSTVLGALVTYVYEIESNSDTTYSQFISLVKINSSGNQELIFLNNRLSENNRFLQPQVFAYKNKIFAPIFSDIGAALKNNMNLVNLARFKIDQGQYKLDKFMPTELNDYLYKNDVNQNYNETYYDHGYSIMSLSNYILNLSTEEKIYLPLDDSIYQNIKMYPDLKGISYQLRDFKYNEMEKLFYIIYAHNNQYYYASFRPNGKTFKTKEFLYTYEGKFNNETKSVVLSWDGKKIIYQMKNEDCLRHINVADLKKIIFDYENAPKL